MAWQERPKAPRASGEKEEEKEKEKDKERERKRKTKEKERNSNQERGVRVTRGTARPRANTGSNVVLDWATKNEARENLNDLRRAGERPPEKRQTEGEKS